MTPQRRFASPPQGGAATAVRPSRPGGAFNLKLALTVVLAMAGITLLSSAMLAEFGKPGATFRMTQRFVEGDYAYILWTAETADNVYELGTDTFFVRDGKIAVQSFAGKLTPKT